MIDLAPALWRLRALCAGRADDLFFPDPHNAAQAQRAIEYCAPCPVRKECLDYALRNGITYGIWGGTTPAQRWIMDDMRRHQGYQMPEIEVEHGTERGARWERRRGRKPCPECLAAERAGGRIRVRDSKARRRERWAENAG